MEVTLIDHMGSDLSVVNAARVSFNKESDWEYLKAETYEEAEAFGKVDHEYIFSDRWMGSYPATRLSDADTKLISYLAKHNHWSPFSHTFLSFHIKAPLFVARQLAKHQVGLAWNEVSRRYVDSEPEFYVPDMWRKRAENVKQGSSDEPVRMDGGWIAEWHTEQLYERQVGVYKRMLELGVCPEQARMVLPQSMMTEWIWSGSLFAFSRVCKLRLDKHTQIETQTVAQAIASHVEKLFPVSWKALNG